MERDNGKIHRILIVEDDRPLAGGLCRALQNEKIETVSCHTLREAGTLLGLKGHWDEAEAGSEKLNNGKADFALIVLDVNLPDGNGFDFLQELKREYDIIVIMLTANDMETDIVAGLEMGADDYITKPFSLAVLRARVATQLRRIEARGCCSAATDAAGNSGNTIKSDCKSADSKGESGLGNGKSIEIALEKCTKDNWVVDGIYRFHFPHMIFMCGEEQVELSKGEQKLLRLLVENRGITLTREQLIDCIWSVDAEFVDENTLSVTVKRLRDKLGAQEKIKTVYGIGYRWE